VNGEVSWLAPQDYDDAPVKAVGAMCKMVCPACGFDYAHHGQVTLVHGFDDYRSRSAGRGDCLRVGFTGECGHNWTVCFSFHKGQMFVYAEMDAPDPEGGVA
jgi:hypothetical protein